MDEEARPRGRPLKFQSVDDLISKADLYFAECEAKGTPLTITGLALALDTSRETLMDYQNRDEFSDAVKKIKLKVENDYEIALREKGRAGDIFGLKNFGWTDKQDVNLGGQPGNPVEQSMTVHFAKPKDD